MQFPPIEPYDSGLLRVSDHDEIYWETSGNPDGIPVLYLHGGPGGGLGKGGYRRRCDPDRVSGLVLMVVTTTSRDEVDWITEGVGRIFPEAWAEFDRGSGRRDGERLVEAYARRLIGGDAEDRWAAAQAWNAWEDVHISLSPGWQPSTGPVDPVRARNFATLVTRYWAHDGFLPGDQSIFSRLDRIAGLPAVLIHGRRDVSGPAITPWTLHQRWPASELIIIDEGHGGEIMIDAMVDAIARLT